MKKKLKKILRFVQDDNSQKGQSLITLLFFMVIGITVITSAALIVSADILGASNAQSGIEVYYAAESGVENGILYLLSHPSYNGTLTDFYVGSVKVSVTIQSNGTITSTATSGSTKKIVQAQASYGSGAFSVSNWKENTY